MKKNVKQNEKKKIKKIDAKIRQKKRFKVEKITSVQFSTLYFTSLHSIQLGEIMRTRFTFFHRYLFEHKRNSISENINDFRM